MLVVALAMAVRYIVHVALNMGLAALVWCCGAGRGGGENGPGLWGGLGTTEPTGRSNDRAPPSTRVLNATQPNKTMGTHHSRTATKSASAGAFSKRAHIEVST